MNLPDEMWTEIFGYLDKVTLHKVAQYILLVIRIRNITLSPRTYNEGLKCTITLSNLYLVSLE